MSDGQPIPDHDFEEVLLYRQGVAGVDFAGYKRTSLMRRVRHRMAQAGVEEYGDYIDQLQVNAEQARLERRSLRIKDVGAPGGAILVMEQHTD